MSLVIYRNNALYADTRAWAGPGVSPVGAKDKVVIAKDGALLGITSGELGMPARVLEAYNAEERFVAGGDFCALIVKPNGELFYWADEAYMVGPLETKFAAVGTGSKYALGVLAYGGTVKRAFEIAAKLDYFTDSKYRRFSHT